MNDEIRNATPSGNGGERSSPLATYRVIPIDAVKVGERFRQDYGDTSELEASIKEKGLLHPLVVDRHLNLIAGGRRHLAVTRLDWTHVPVVVARKVTDAMRVAAECDENEVRKDYTDAEALRILKVVYGEEKAKAKMRQRQHGHTAPGRQADTPANAKGVKKGEALELAAKKAGLSKTKARRLLAGSAGVKHPAAKPKVTGERAILARLKRFEKAALKLLEDLGWVMNEMFGASKTRIPPRYYKKLGQTFQRLATDSTRLRKRPN